MAGSCEPVFIKCKDIPPSDYDFRYTPLDICYAAENVGGEECINGCQNIRGLMRLYPKTRDARNTILTSGLMLYDTAITVYDKNPFIIREGATKETPSTRVLIGELPISVANTEIETALVRVGCELRSPVIDEKARGRDGKLTRFLTGRRFTYITTPTKPLDKTLKICSFNVSISHREQDAQPRPCRKCLQPGHNAFVCTNEMVCLACRQPGHRKGDPCCPAISETADAVIHESHESHEQNDGQEERASSDDDESEESEAEGETESKADYESASDTADKEAPVHHAALQSTSPAETTTSEAAVSASPAPAPAADNTLSATGSECTASAKKDGRNAGTAGKKKDKRNKNTKDVVENNENNETRSTCRPDTKKQTKLPFESRSRSETPSKRAREKDGDSPKLEERRARLD